MAKIHACCTPPMPEERESAAECRRPVFPSGTKQKSYHGCHKAIRRFETGKSIYPSDRGWRYPIRAKPFP
jgi:hypothetical protein